MERPHKPNLEETAMRALAWMVFWVVLGAAPTKAQTYDPNFPICLQTYGRAGSYIACGYTSMSQCTSSASGRAAQCLVNPYYAGAHRRRRFVY
jgi:hypothetical protein